MEGHQRPGEALWVKLSWREENRANDWIGARAVEPTCPTTGAGWGSGGGGGGGWLFADSFVGVVFRPTGGWGHTQGVGSATGVLAMTAPPARASAFCSYP